jgi:hypothetical protein
LIRAVPPPAVQTWDALLVAPAAGSVYPEIRAGSLPPIPLSKATKMSERLETLNKARARMVEDRDAHAKVLAAPFDRDKAERARNKFIEIQVLIDALDRAIGGEGRVAQEG